MTLGNNATAVNERNFVEQLKVGLTAQTAVNSAKLVERRLFDKTALAFP
ncbi:MAG: hypothetical protein ACI4JZ_05105 [Oscillospiraceae bacterium]